MIPNRKKRLADAYMACKHFMVDHGCTYHAIDRIDDIMLASIRTLGFLWDSNANRSLDHILDSIIMQMSEIAANETGSSKEEIYVLLVGKKD